MIAIVNKKRSLKSKDMQMAGDPVLRPQRGGVLPPLGPRLLRRRKIRLGKASISKGMAPPQPTGMSCGALCLIAL